jgi:hypothetical protein
VHVFAIPSVRARSRCVKVVGGGENENPGVLTYTSDGLDRHCEDCLGCVSWSGEGVRACDSRFVHRYAAAA